MHILMSLFHNYMFNLHHYFLNFIRIIYFLDFLGRDSCSFFVLLLFLLSKRRVLVTEGQTYIIYFSAISPVKEKRRPLISQIRGWQTFSLGLKYFSLCKSYNACHNYSALLFNPKADIDMA